MTNSFNPGDLARLAQNLLTEQSNGQEFMLLDVHRQTREAYEQFPEDPVIRQVAFVIEKMTERAPQGTTISQADLSRIHNEFVRLSENSKFRMILGHLLLGNVKTASTNDFVRMNRLDAEDSGLNTDDFVDQNLVNALDIAMGGKGTLKAYDQKLAERGVEYVKLELTSLGFKNPKVEIMGGDGNTLVYASHFDTIHGLVTVAVPIDLQSGKLVLPSTFVADSNLQELTTANVQTFVDKKSATRDFSTPNVRDILTAVGILTGRSTAPAQDEFSKLADNFGNTKDMQMAVPSLFVDRKYEAPKADINTTEQVEMPQELAHLARDFEDSVLEAASAFGKAAINTGKGLVARELVSAGFKNAQVRFGSESGDSVIYLASINTPKGPVEIEVPVEMQVVADKYVPLLPTYFAYDGLVEDFTAPKLQRFAINLPAPSTQNKTYAAAYTYMLLPELKDEILKAAADNDYVTCETILNHIEEKFTEEDHKNAIADYQYILITKSKVATQEQHSCSKMIPAGKGSIYARCGHYGVPMQQVVAGPDGHCMLKTSVEKEKLNPNDQGGAAISTAKVFMS